MLVSSYCVDLAGCAWHGNTAFGMAMDLTIVVATAVGSPNQQNPFNTSIISLKHSNIQNKIFMYCCVNLILRMISHVSRITKNELITLSGEIHVKLFRRSLLRLA